MRICSVMLTMSYYKMTDAEKRRKLGEMKEYLNMDKYITGATKTARVKTIPGGTISDFYTVEESEEFKKKMIKCVSYHNTVYDNEIQNGRQFVKKFVKIEKRLKKAYKGDCRENAEKLREQMSELAESWRKDFGLEKSVSAHPDEEYDGPYHPKIIYNSLALLADKNRNPKFPHRPSLQIVQDVENNMNSDLSGDRLEINPDTNVVEEDDIDDEDVVAESEFLGIIENMKQVRISTSFESIQGHRGTRNSMTSNIDILFAQYLIEERGLDDSEIPQELRNRKNFRNVFCGRTDEPEEFLRSVDEVVTGMQRVGMLNGSVNSIGGISRSTVDTKGDYGRDLSQILDTLCDYAQDAYNRAERLVDNSQSDSLSSF